MKLIPAEPCPHHGGSQNPACDCREAAECRAMELTIHHESSLVWARQEHRAGRFRQAADAYEDAAYYLEAAGLHDPGQSDEDFVRDLRTVAAECRKVARPQPKAAGGAA